MSRIPPFSQFAAKRPLGNALQQALLLERFTDQFVETRQGSCWLDGDNGWLLAPDERREFTARAQEIIEQRFAYERRATRAVIVMAPIVFMAMLWVLQSLAKLPEPWPMGLSVGFTAMLSMSMAAASWWQEWKLAQLRERMRLRMRGRDAMPAQVVKARRRGNPWLLMAQGLASVTIACAVAYTLFDQSGMGVGIPLPEGLTMPAVGGDDFARWSGGLVMLVWLLVGLSRIRRWRNGREDARLAEDRRLARETLPVDTPGLVHPLAAEIDRL